MPTLPEILNRLQFLTQETALLGLFITATIILVARNWRWSILALLAQYVLVGFILSRLVRTDIATLKVMIGAFICPILFLSARQVSGASTFNLLPGVIKERRIGSGMWRNWWQRLVTSLSFLRGQDRRQGVEPTGLLFRLFIAALMILVAATLSRSFSLPGLPQNVTTAVYWLILAGLVTLTLTEYPIKAGHGLFTALTGFDLVYTPLERSLLITGLWGAATLLIALAIGYLTVIRGVGPEEEL